MNKYLVALIISLSLFFVLNSADGFQSSKNQDIRQDTPIELMPNKQKDFLAKHVELNIKYLENKKNETNNAVVKKEIAAKIMNEFKDLLNNANEDIASNGVKDWVGTVVVKSSSIGLYIDVNSKTIIHLIISTTGMNKEVLDNVKLLNSGNVVKFSIESTKEFKLKFNEKYLNSVINTSVKPSNLTSLVPVNKK